MKAAVCQRDRVLRALEGVGSLGLTVEDFDGTRDVIDGGPRLKRLAARIGELRDEGYEIETRTEVVNGSRYARYILRGSEKPRHGDGDGRGGLSRTGRVGVSEGLVRDGQSSTVVVTSDADCLSEGLFDTDEFKPAPEYPS